MSPRLLSGGPWDPPLILTLTLTLALRLIRKNEGKPMKTKENWGKPLFSFPRTYKNVSTDGTTFGVGYSKFLGDSPVGLRIEGIYLELDNVSTDNGVSKTGATVANGGRNQVDASNLEGLQAKVAITITLGKD